MGRKKQSSEVNEASVILEQAAEEAKEEKKLSPQEQLEAMKLYVQSMEKVEGHTNQQVRDIIETVARRFILALNYSISDNAQLKSVKMQLNNIVSEELVRYKDE